MNGQYIGSRPAKITKSTWKDRTLESARNQMLPSDFKTNAKKETNKIYTDYKYVHPYWSSNYFFSLWIIAYIFANKYCNINIFWQMIEITTIENVLFTFTMIFLSLYLLATAVESKPKWFMSKAFLKCKKI